MKTNKLLFLLQSLSEKEQKAFAGWLKGPCHNKRQDVLRLYSLIKRKDEQAMTKEELFGLIYPERSYSDVMMRQLIHLLQKALQQFLVFEQLLRNEQQMELELTRIYRQRKLDGLFHKHLRAVRRKRQQSPLRNNNYYQLQYQLHLEEFAAISENRRSIPVNLQEMGEALEINFIVSKLLHSCHALSHQNVYKTEYQPGLLDKILEYIEEQQLLKIPIIQLYYHCYKALSASNNNSHFTQLKQLLITTKAQLEAKEIRELYLLALNHCIRAINQGSQKYLREAFELYRLGIAQDFLINDGKLTPFTYRNAITAGLNLKEFDWVYQFIHDYKDALDIQFRENNFQYCLAKYYYEQKIFEQASPLLHNLKFEDTISNLAVRTLQLKIYFENGDYDLLEALLGSFKAFVRRHKLISYHKENYLNIIQLTQRLVTTNLFDREKKKGLKAEIEALQPLTERDWLLEQLR
ncbi:MAG: hypothetical protein AAGG75_24360 [Bacteroidota bacterium]